MTDLQHAYLAGFFDGEGSVAVYRSGVRGYRLCVQVTQNSSNSSERLLQELPLLFGGCVTRELRKGLQHTICYKSTGVAAAFFLQCVRPFLRLKCVEVDIAMRWWVAKERGHMTNEGSEEVVWQLKDLKRSVHK